MCMTSNGQLQKLITKPVCRFVENLCCIVDLESFKGVCTLCMLEQRAVILKVLYKCRIKTALFRSPSVKYVGPRDAIVLYTLY